MQDLFSAIIGPFTVVARQGLRVKVTVDGQEHHLSYEQCEALILALGDGLDKASYWGTNKQLRHPDAPQPAHEVDRIKEHYGIA